MLGQLFSDLENLSKIIVDQNKMDCRLWLKRISERIKREFFLKKFTNFKTDFNLSLGGLFPRQQI